MDQVRITEWETRLAFLEHTLDSLSEVIREQAEETILLKKEIRILKDKIWDLEQNEEGPESKAPPHY